MKRVFPVTRTVGGVAERKIALRDLNLYPDTDAGDQALLAAINAGTVTLYDRPVDGKILATAGARVNETRTDAGGRLYVSAKSPVFTKKVLAFPPATGINLPIPEQTARGVVNFDRFPVIPALRDRNVHLCGPWYASMADNKHFDHGVTSINVWPYYRMGPSDMSQVAAARKLYFYGDDTPQAHARLLLADPANAASPHRAAWSEWGNNHNLTTGDPMAYQLIGERMWGDVKNGWDAAGQGIGFIAMDVETSGNLQYNRECVGAIYEGFCGKAAAQGLAVVPITYGQGTFKIDIIDQSTKQFLTGYPEFLRDYEDLFPTIDATLAALNKYHGAVSVDGYFQGLWGMEPLLKRDSQGNPILSGGKPVYNDITSTTAYGQTMPLEAEAGVGIEAKRFVSDLYRHAARLFNLHYWLANGYPEVEGSRRAGMENINIAAYTRVSNEGVLGMVYNDRPLPYWQLKLIQMINLFDAKETVQWGDDFNNLPVNPGANSAQWTYNAQGTIEAILDANQDYATYDDYHQGPVKRAWWNIDMVSKNDIDGEYPWQKPIVRTKIRTVGDRQYLEILAAWPLLDQKSLDMKLWLTKNGKTSSAYTITIPSGRQHHYSLFALPADAEFAALTGADLRLRFVDILGVTRTWPGDYRIMTTFDATVATPPDFDTNSSIPTLPPVVTTSSSSSSTPPGTSAPGVYGTVNDAGILTLSNNLAGPSEFRLYGYYGDYALDGAVGQWQSGAALSGGGGYQKGYGSIYDGIVSPGNLYRVQTRLTASPGIIYSAVLLMDNNQSTAAIGTGSTSSVAPPTGSSSTSSTSSPPPVAYGIAGTVSQAGVLTVVNNLPGSSEFRLYGAGDFPLDGEAGTWHTGTTIQGVGMSYNWGNIYTNGIVSPDYYYRIQTRQIGGDGTIYSALLLMSYNQSTPPIGNAPATTSTTSAAPSTNGFAAAWYYDTNSKALVVYAQVDTGDVTLQLTPLSGQASPGASVLMNAGLNTVLGKDYNRQYLFLPAANGGVDIATGSWRATLVSGAKNAIGSFTLRTVNESGLITTGVPSTTSAAPLTTSAAPVTVSSSSSSSAPPPVIGGNTVAVSTPSWLTSNVGIGPVLIPNSDAPAWTNNKALMDKTKEKGGNMVTVVYYANQIPWIGLNYFDRVAQYAFDIGLKIRLSYWIIPQLNTIDNPDVPFKDLPALTSSMMRARDYQGNTRVTSGNGIMFSPFDAAALNWQKQTTLVLHNHCKAQAWYSAVILEGVTWSGTGECGFNGYDNSLDPPRPILSGYDAASLAYFRQVFLPSKYGSIANLNAAYGSSYGSFGEVTLPQPFASTGEDDLNTAFYGARGIDFYDLREIGFRNQVAATMGALRGANPSMALLGDVGSFIDGQTPRGGTSNPIAVFGRNADGRKSNANLGVDSRLWMDCTRAGLGPNGFYGNEVDGSGEGATAAIREHYLKSADSLDWGATLITIANWESVDRLGQLFDQNDGRGTLAQYIARGRVVAADGATVTISRTNQARLENGAAASQIRDAMQNHSLRVNVKYEMGFNTPVVG